MGHVWKDYLLIILFFAAMFLCPYIIGLYVAGCFIFIPAYLYSKSKLEKYIVDRRKLVFYSALLSIPLGLTAVAVLLLALVNIDKIIYSLLITLWSGTTIIIPIIVWKENFYTKDWKSVLPAILMLPAICYTIDPIFFHQYFIEQYGVVYCFIVFYICAIWFYEYWEIRTGWNGYEYTHTRTIRPPEHELRYAGREEWIRSLYGTEPASFGKKDTAYLTILLTGATILLLTLASTVIARNFFEQLILYMR